MATGRDLLTSTDGETRILGEARIDASVDYLDGRLLALRSTPRDARLEALAGTSAYAGFRAAVLKACPEEAGSHSLRYQLLDDLPVAVMANGRVLRAEGLSVTRQTERRPPIDLCAGFARDGLAIANFGVRGAPLIVGPDAPDPVDPADPLGWHAIGAPVPHQTRRLRRIDVWRDGGTAFADAFFRDSHVDGAGRHTVVHWWSISAEIDPVERRFRTIGAMAGPLPYPECPGAAASAARLVGMPVDGVRKAVRDGFTGPSTCTHLNDSLRALEDVGALLDGLG